MTKKHTKAKRPTRSRARAKKRAADLPWPRLQRYDLGGGTAQHGDFVKYIDVRRALSALRSQLTSAMVGRLEKRDEREKLQHDGEIRRLWEILGTGGHDIFHQARLVVTEAQKLRAIRETFQPGPEMPPNDDACSELPR